MSVYLVSGATGFIGKRLIQKLKSDNHQIICLARKTIPGMHTIVCNFESTEILSIDMRGVDFVIHLAGLSHDFRNPSKISHIYHKVNVSATIQLAKLAALSDVKGFVFISSVKAGGVSHSTHCSSESDINIPEGVYGATKREAELGLLEIEKKVDMRVSIVRPSLVYGPGVKGNMQMMLSGVKSGWFPPLPETGNKRSMIHVDDLIRVILMISKNSMSSGEIFIATDGYLYSSREIYETMCFLAGRSVPSWSVPKFFFDIASLLGSNIKYKIKKLLGNECYSSDKLLSLGFNPKRLLRDMNKSSFD
jgi:UDP-glucose 4-epimerase